MHEVPGAHVRRLLLDPPHLRRGRVAVEHAEDVGLGPRVELLHPHDRDRGTDLVAPVHQLVRDLAGAEQDPADRCRVRASVDAVVEHALEPAVGERLDGGTGCAPSGGSASA